MKSCTDIEQSKKLVEILPMEIADMWYCPYPNDVDWYDEPNIGKAELLLNQLPCWSLAALLDYLSANFHVDIKHLDNYWELDCRVQVTYGKELVDACYEMILKLREQNLL